VLVAADPPQKREELVTKLGLKFPLVSDEDLSIARSYGVRQENCDCALPSVFILDAENRVRVAKVGDNIVERATAHDIAEGLAQAAAPAKAAQP
jgi:peroxiredoxin